MHEPATTKKTPAMKRISEFPAPEGGRLTDDMLSAFEDAGVVILRKFAAPEACVALKRRATALVDAFDPASVRSVFSTKSNAQLDDDYFIQSGGDIRFFFEEDAFGADGALKRPKIDSLNKLGHAMHDLDPVFDEFSHTPALAEIAARLGFADPKIVQSMYILKPPGIGGEVVCHQDSTYLLTEPESCIGFWFAIDDADLENGCMHFLPGAHKGPLRKLNKRAPGGGLVTETLDETPFPEHLAAPAPARRGDMVIFHGRAPHLSAANRSSRSRHAYTLHVVDGACRWPPENWLQRPPELPFRGFV